MDTGSGLDQHRRSRLRSFAGALGHAFHLDRAVIDNRTELDGIPNLVERFTPDQLASYQASISRDAAMSASAAAAGVTRSSVQATRVGALPATQGTTLATTLTTVPNTYTLVSPTAVTVLSSSSAVTSSLSSAAMSSSTSLAPSSSTTSSSSSTSSSAPSSSPTVLTITSNPPSSSASPTATFDTIASAASNSSSTTSSMSTGAIVGVVLAVLVGVVAAGSFIGWAYRKWATRGYNSSSPWKKMRDNDDDLTPFPAHEKGPSADDYYGDASEAPVIGSRRALAMARQNAFNGDGSYRPESDYMIAREGNRAGVGAGAADLAGDFAGYPAVNRSPPRYGVDAQGRPYNAQAGRTPMAHMYDEQYRGGGGSPPSSGRQLVGPGAYGNVNSDIMPVPMGRPAPPASHADLMQHEDFADEPPTPRSGDVLPYEEPNTASTTSTKGDWPSNASAVYRPEGRNRTSVGPAGQHVGTTNPPQVYPGSPPTYSSPARNPSASSPPRNLTQQPVRSQMPLPSFEPLSPLMSAFDLQRRSGGQALATAAGMYQDERSRQKVLYGEVARAAGVLEPITPKTPGFGLNDSTTSTNTANTTNTSNTSSSGTTSSSFSTGPARLPPLPSLVVSMPQPATQPYVHGRPLSPLDEVSTPGSGVPISSSSLMHGQDSGNPFDHLAPYGQQQAPQHYPYAGQMQHQQQRSLLPQPPHSAASMSTTGATSFPSPAYPPPSPGGMSVPGSVTDSPRRWSGHAGGGNSVGRVGRGMSMFGDDDAYGGI